MDKPWVCLSRRLWSVRAAKRWFWKWLPQRQHRPKKDGCQFKWRTCLMIGPCIFTDYKMLQEKKWQHYMLYMLLLWPVELRNYVGISTALVLTTAELHFQRGVDTKRQEGVAPGRRGHSLPVQLDRYLGTSLCCTSTRSLASCSETNSVTKALPKPIHLIDHPCLIPVFRFNMKPDLD